MPIHLPPISRRSFLAGSLAAGAGLLLPRMSWAGERPVDPNHWAMLADTHIGEQRDGVHLGVKPAVNLGQAVEEILALTPRPGGVIVAGDCALREGHIGDYAVLLDLVKPIRAAGMPVHFALGNHDQRENFWKSVPDTRPTPKATAAVAEKYVSVLETPHANWFMLDSLDKTNVTPGLLGKAQLAWLAKALDARPEKPAIVLAHHFLTSPQRPKDGLQDFVALQEVMGPRRQVKAYVFGHSHRWEHSTWRGIHLINLPASAYVFDPAQPHAWVDLKVAPAGVTLVLHSLVKGYPKDGERIELAWRTKA